MTWRESYDQSPAPPGFRNHGLVFDGMAVGTRATYDEVEYSDMTLFSPVAVAPGGELGVVTCTYNAPAAFFYCNRRDPDGKNPAKIFDLRNDGQGPLRPALGAVVTPTDALVFFPLGAEQELLPLSASVTGKKKRVQLAHDDQQNAPHADGIGAVVVGDEVAAVYRYKGAVLTRRVGFDEKWRGKAVALSAPKAEAGAPVVASRGSEIVALFSERPDKKTPYAIKLADLVHDPVVLATGSEEAQAPGIAAGETCFVASWVEGTGKTTRTKLAPLCAGKLDVEHALALSTDGVEGGRAYLAKDAVVWQEIPPGKPAELRVAKLVCP